MQHPICQLGIENIGFLKTSFEGVLIQETNPKATKTRYKLATFLSRLSIAGDILNLLEPFLKQHNAVNCIMTPIKNMNRW